MAMRENPRHFRRGFSARNRF